MSSSRNAIVAIISVFGLIAAERALGGWNPVSKAIARAAQVARCNPQADPLPSRDLEAVQDAQADR